MRIGTRVIFITVGVVLLLLGAPLAAGPGSGLDGTWILDSKASKDVPESMKMIDLKISLRGKVLSTTRLFDGAPVGEPFIVTLDGSLDERDIAKGQRARITAKWKSEGKSYELVIRTKASNLLDVIQTTLVQLSDDSQKMTRFMTTVTGGSTQERILVYRRKE